MKPKDVLQPCPFCGGEAQVNTWTMHGITESRCFCSNSDCPNSVRTVALEQWNTRPIEDALTARIAELEAENDRLQSGWFRDETICPDGSLRPTVSQLLSRIAELEAERRWIPVSERLPEDGETVFVIIHDGFERFENGNEVARLTYLGNGNWWSWESERYIVTHWSPLPKFPEVQE